MSLSPEDFDAFHTAVHGYAPFAWQSRLLRQIVHHKAWPSVLDLPTGSGKTTCIDIALFALALDAEQRTDRWCPRRIAMVVDRRVVVDQVAERGRKLLQALLMSTASPVVEVASRLRSLSRESEEPVGVYTLRGGIPKEDTWARTPDQPLIMASTVDQIGSRLLIQGYGVSVGMRPVHAGLIGNDLLLLLDEVHLSQPFKQTLSELARLRGRTQVTVPHRFQHAFLSATPGESGEAPFRLLQEEVSLASALGPRLHATKPVRLEEADDRQGLEHKCIQHARRLLERHRVVAIVVNRVTSASVIARQLREGSGVDVELLTGRMRPLDRDQKLARLLPRIMTGRRRTEDEEPLVVVGTQCIEAGADFDVDALVTEAASFDALRQRFGRVDRLGTYGRAEGVIVYDKSSKDDPVYRSSLATTTSWLKAHLRKKTKDVDFGVLALPSPATEELPALLAPKPNAPPLLPAYLDLWMQTSPTPIVSPDPALWLHGPQSGPADVQVIWRADLTDDDLRDRERATAIVASVTPSALEAISVPFVAARRWLQGAPASDIVDVEGSSQDAADDLAGERALRWTGVDSTVVDATGLRPGDTIVVPAARGGIRDSCFDATSREPVHDLAERAALFARGVPTLRLHPAILAQHGFSVPGDDASDARATLRSLAEAEEVGWRSLWFRALANSKKAIVVAGAHPWLVLRGPRLPAEQLRRVVQLGETLEPGIELSTDDEESLYAGRPIRLDAHSRDVETFARAFATSVGLPESLTEDIALAGWLHDIGKADRRFQIMLRGGSEIAFYKEEMVLAKSGMPVGAMAAQRLARERSGYPAGARHEVQSLAMLEQHYQELGKRAHDLELVLHLVGSHHGYCRPFAPPVVDESPIFVSLTHHRSETFGQLEFAPTRSDHQLGSIDSAIPDRFWRLVARYGWLELCWLESILRLADHRASESEQEAGDEA